MTIQRKPKKATNDIDLKAANQFISGIAVPAKVNKVPVALRFDPELLRAIDAIAARRGMSRNAIISYWCSKGVEED